MVVNFPITVSEMEIKEIKNWVDKHILSVNYENGYLLLIEFVSYPNVHNFYN